MIEAATSKSSQFFPRSISTETAEQPGNSLQDFGKGRPGHQIGAMRMDRVLNTAFAEIQERHPHAGTVQLYRLFTEELPYFISSESQLVVSQAIENEDCDISGIGKRVFILLNMRTVLSAAEKYFTGNPDQDDDLMQAGIIHLLTGISKPMTDNQTNNTYQYVYSLVKTGVAQEIASKENLPVDWVRDFRISVVQLIDELFTDYPYGLTEERISKTAWDISEKTGIPAASIKTVINGKNYLVRNPSDETTDEEDLIETAIQPALKDAVNTALSTLSNNQQIIIKARAEGCTLKKAAMLIGRTPTRARQLESGAIRKLRHPNRSRKLKPYFSPELYGVIFQPEQPLPPHEFIDMQALTKKYSPQRSVTIAQEEPTPVVRLVDSILVDPIRLKYRYPLIGCWDDSIGLWAIDDIHGIPDRLNKHTIDNLAQLLTASDSSLRRAGITEDQISQIKARVMEFLEKDAKVVTISSGKI